MFSLRSFDNLICSAPLLLAVSLTGCGGLSEDEAYYLGNDEAVREHMQEVESDERANFQKTQQSQPLDSTAAMFPQERPGGN
jgi:hypothetical protein